MATESPIRMPGSSGKWSPLKEASTFAPPTGMIAEDLGLLLKGNTFHGTSRDAVPNRSGSAPPSMEGSFLAISNLISQQNLNANLECLNSAIANCESEEQLRADPAYLAYYCSNVNMNPRLPPPLISSENRRLVRHIGSFGKKWELTGNTPSHVPQGMLSTHKEECEDDNTPQQPTDDQVDDSCRLWPMQNPAPFSGEHKDLVNLLHEQLPSDPSSACSQSYSSSHGITKEAVDHDANSGSLNDSFVSTSNPVPYVPGSNDREMSSNSDHSAGSVSRSSSLHYTGSLSGTPPPQRGILDDPDIQIQDELLISGVNISRTPVIESELKALNLSSLPNSGKQRNHEQWRQSLLQPHGHQQQSNSFQPQNSKSHMPSQGGTPSFIGTDHYPYGPSKFSTDQTLQSSGFTPSLYAAATAYITSANPHYPNQPAPTLFPPQYSIGGYPLNSNILPPYIAGYPQGTVPLVFDGSGAAGPSFHAQTSGISTGGSFAHGGDTQHLNKLYGQLGFTVQPTFADPLYMAYYQQPFGEAYGMPSQFEPFASHDGSVGNQVGSLNSHKRFDTISDDQKFQNQRGGFMSNLNQQRGAVAAGPNYFGSMSYMGIMQYQTQLHTSPVMPGPSVSGTNLNGERKEMRFPQSHSRSSSVYSGWQGQKGYGNFEDPKVYNFLEDLKSGKGRRFELSDIAGHIVEFSADQHGSRFIQQKLENCSDEEKSSVFKEVLPHAPKLMTDVFGNYVVQKFFEYGSPDQRRQLANQLAGHILPLTLQMYGCRVIQKALDVIELQQKVQLIHELDGHVMRCVRDQNGNHVIQKCIESVPTEKIGFVISAFRGHVATLSMHPYGCRVVQRVLERCTDELQCQFIVDEILESVCDLAQDQYGNYVTQHVLERGRPSERGQIINKFSGHVVQLSQHKFASNVVEKCLEYGDPAERDLMIQEIVGHNEGVDNLLIMMKDQFANYVVQKVLETCPDDQRVILLGRIRVHVNALKKYTYGKHIAARFEQLYGEDETAGGS